MTDAQNPSFPQSSTPFAVIAQQAGPGRKWLVMGWGGLTLAVLVGVSALHGRTVNQEEMQWARQLELSSAQSVEAAAALSRTQLQVMEQVAGNVSVQLYMTQLQHNEISPEGGVVPERQYLENLLIATASKGGFQPNMPADAMVNANVTPPLQSGIALLDGKGQMVAATRAMPPVKERLESFLNAASKVQASASEPVSIGQGRYAMYFQAPIFAVQSDAAEPNYIGRVVGVRLLDAKLLQNVLTPKNQYVKSGLVVTDAEQAHLLEAKDGELALLPLPKGTEAATPLEKLAMDTPGTVHKGMLADGRAGFAIAQAVPGTQLQLLQQVDRTKAMKDVYQQLLWLWVVVSLGLIGFGTFLWAMVRHSAAIRSAMVADQYQALAKKLDTKSRLLGLVTEHTPNIITILDDQGRVCFTNWRAPAGIELSLEDTQGKTLIAMLGADAAKALLARSQDALTTGKMQIALELRDTPAGRRHYQCVHLPLASIPVDLPFLHADSTGVLIIEEDITPLMTERERQERTLHRVVDCLVDFVDRRDPYAARHSAQVALLARGVAQTLQQAEVVQETAELAGKLLNVGKMQVPEDVLAQSGSLNADMLNRIRDAISSSAAVVEGIEFRGPVAETIRQSLERVDGQGPLHLTGEGILLSARVVAVANAFVGMTSQRAYRAPLSAEVAIEQLMKSAGTAFDPSVVAALVLYLENHGGHKELAQMLA